MRAGGARPEPEEVGALARGIEVASLTAAAGLLALHLARLVAVRRALPWWTLVLVPMAAALADLASGVVHWVADTWGSETMPVLGPRFLKPFRTHHSNPDAFLQRDFIDCNGDVGLLTAAMLLPALWIPLGTTIGCAAAVVVVAFCAAALPTNQVHQWAHQGHAPRLVAWLQRSGLILSYAAHATHHEGSQTTNYCITTGWWNRTLTALDAFSALERAISRSTRLVPRDGR